ncbi:MAG: exodeoxyribonuclease VII small subunit [Kiritimatiellae bacterium]|jgi:exodeoxyribonuclease VII small subunit|nr:exodeoxyribonuclease VII small subunit [Kiritimatiellia bacterium]
MTEKKQKFEESMAELQKVTSEMESGDLSLEEMIAHFEKGQKLIKTCSAKLNEIEKKVEIITKKADGKIAVENFDYKDTSDDGPRQNLS